MSDVCSEIQSQFCKLFCLLSMRQCLRARAAVQGEIVFVEQVGIGMGWGLTLVFALEA